MDADGADTAQVLVRQVGRLGRITLNRPKSINALTLGMIRTVDQALRAWEDDSSVEMLVLDGAGGRGLCAGGDITVVRESALGDHEIAARLWREEYALDQRMARFPRPVVAWMDGVVMGGGIGLAGRADLRVVTGRSTLAMPEVSIGLTPDVGAADLLARAPGELGAHLAMTGDRIGPSDALLCGLADRLLPADAFAGLLEALQELDPEAAASAVDGPIGAVPAGELAAARPWVDECYRGCNPAGIVRRLRERPEPAARAAAERIERQSPTSVSVALRSIRAARSEPGLEACLIRDYRAVRRFLDHPDLPEGISARIVHRDRPPRWSPPRLADVEPAEVDRYFAPLGADELRLEPVTHPR